MEIIRAANAGFCLGVSLALKKLELALDAIQNSSNLRICTLGPIIHNPQVLAHFTQQGVMCINADQAQPDDYILIRAHGITRQTEEQLRKQCRHVEDATCPKVKKTQLGIAKATTRKTLLLFGEADHPEVRGLVSYAQGSAHIFNSLEELENIPLYPDRGYVLASQTTQDKALFEAIAKKLTEKLPRLKILDTICNATRDRQNEAQKIAAQVDAMIIVGGKNSGNTRRLADLAAKICQNTWHVEQCNELQPEWFENIKKVGLAAGASTPKNIIDGIENWLEKI